MQGKGGDVHGVLAVRIFRGSRLTIRDRKKEGEDIIPGATLVHELTNPERAAVLSEKGAQGKNS